MFENDYLDDDYYLDSAERDYLINFKQKSQLRKMISDGKIWCYYISCQYTYNPTLVQINSIDFYESDKTDIRVTEYGFGQMTHTIDKSKIIMVGERQEIMEKFKIFDEVRKSFDEVKRKLAG